MNTPAQAEDYGAPEYEPNILVVTARNSGGGLWRAAGGEVSLEELEISGALSDRLHAWSAKFEFSASPDGSPERAKALLPFVAEGLSIARDIQATLGESYQILFFDEAKLEADGFMSDYLYPAGFP